MLNFQKVKEEFEKEFYDILRWEVLYLDKDRNVAYALETRMKNYIDIFWSNYAPDYTVSLKGSIISCKVEFGPITNLIPFGFQFSTDLSLIRQQKKTWI